MLLLCPQQEHRNTQLAQALWESGGWARNLGPSIVSFLAHLRGPPLDVLALALARPLVAVRRQKGYANNTDTLLDWTEAPVEEERATGSAGARCQHLNVAGCTPGSDRTGSA